MYQKIILVGFLGANPEMKFLPDGTGVTSFSVATSNRYTSNGQKVDETIWWRVEAWGKLSEVTNQYLQKGSKVLVEGVMKPDKSTGGPRIWTRSDGTPAASFEIKAQTVKFLSPKSEGDAQGSQKSGLDDDAPF